MVSNVLGRTDLFGIVSDIWKNEGEIFAFVMELEFEEFFCFKDLLLLKSTLQWQLSLPDKPFIKL